MKNEKPSVLFVGSDLSPPYTTMESKMVNTLINHLSGKFNFKIISINVSKNKQEQTNIIKIRGIYSGPIFFRKLFYGIELLFVYLAVLLKNKVNIVHFIWVGFDPLTQLMIKMAKFRGAKVIVTVLNKYAPMSRYKFSDQLIFHSIFSKNELLENNPSIATAKIIPPPVNERTFKKQERPYFVFASGPRTVEQIKVRGVFLLLDAMRILQDANEKITLRFVGRWPEGAKLLDEIVQKRELKNVLISHNHINDMDTVIGEASGLIIPYVGESIGDIPLSALESLAFGTPVITSHEFHVQSADEEPAIRVCAQEPEALAKAMVEVSKLGDVSKLCKSVIRDCNTDKFIKSYDDVYSEYEC
jgi:glycosyltransferase involved in cell wall biosynthesis